MYIHIYIYIYIHIYIYTYIYIYRDPEIQQLAKFAIAETYRRIPGQIPRLMISIPGHHYFYGLDSIPSHGRFMAGESHIILYIHQLFLHNRPISILIKPYLPY